VKYSHITYFSSRAEGAGGSRMMRHRPFGVSFDTGEGAGILAGA